MPESLRKQTAIAYLQAYFADTQKKFSAVAPDFIFIGRDLYDAYRNELEETERVVYTYGPDGLGNKGYLPFLLFKGCKLGVSGTGWGVKYATWSNGMGINYNTETFWRNRSNIKPFF